MKTTKKHKKKFDTKLCTEKFQQKDIKEQNTQTQIYNQTQTHTHIHTDGHKNTYR